MFKKATEAPAPKGGFRDVNAEQEDKPASTDAKGAKKPGKGKKGGKPSLAAAAGAAASKGHNSGLIPAAVEIVKEILEWDAKIREINKAKRDLRNRLKNEFGVLAAVQGYEIAMAKKDPDVRLQIESGIVDFRKMLGRQMDLDLKEGTVARTEEEYADPTNRVPADRIAREG